MIVETSKKMLYAAVGAPVVTARRVADRITGVSGKVHDLRDRMSDDLAKELDAWASEGEKLIERVMEREAVEGIVDDIVGRVDLDQIQEQVGKLRENLDEMLQSWRSSFRPEPATPQKVEVVEEPAKKPAAKKPAAKKTPAKKPATKKPATATKKPAAKKPAAKKPATAAKKPAAKKATTAA